MIRKSIIPAIALTCLILAPQPGGADQLKPGEVTQIQFENKECSPTLYTMFTGKPSIATLQVRLPDDYNLEEEFPLLLYVPGWHGNVGGNIQNAIDIGGTEGCIVASLPLFKQSVDTTEPGRGMIISFEDYRRLTGAYRIMLGRLFELLPNIDVERSAMVGYSNGAIATAVLVTCHDEFILQHFRSFCLVDQGMFHLTDLHKSISRDCRYLLLAGGQAEFGRDQKIRACKLLQDSWQLIGVDLQHGIREDVGHELEPFKSLIGEWFRDRALRVDSRIEP